MQAGVLGGFVVFPTLYLLYINDNPETTGCNLVLFADDICLYTTYRMEDYILRKLQHGPSSKAAWCERLNIKFNEYKTQAIYFSHRIRSPEPLLKLSEQNIPSVNSVKYLSVIFDKKITWRPHTETIKAKAFRTLEYNSYLKVSN
jgi:hypothetical protein